jgi:hypothetical protein
MSVSIYKVDFDISKPATGAGKKDLYRKGVRTVILEAASSHPKDVLATLANNFVLASGEIFEILAVQQVVGGTEGSGILQ